MKLLWLSHFVPYPPRGGAHQRSFNLLRNISRRYETTLVALNLQGESSARVAEYTAELSKYCARVEIWDLPRRWKGARWWAELVISPLYRLPYSCRALWSPQLNARWQQTLKQHPQAFLYFESIDLSLFSTATQGYRRSLNHQNCESAMAYRRADKENNPLKKVYIRAQAQRLEALERQICRQFDVNIAVSDLDAQILRSQSPTAHFHIVENGTDTSYFTPTVEEPASNSLIFAGSLNWYPNLSAVQFFLASIWPLVKKQCPGVRFYLAGQKPPDWMLQLPRQDSSLTVVPNPEDMRPWMARATAFVCPIVDGGGTRLKILDALALGKAVVSTTVGAEGLKVKHGESILLADDPREFAQEVLRVLENKDLRKRLEAAGRALVEQNYGWEILGARLNAAFRCAMKLEDCRSATGRPATAEAGSAR